MNYIDFDQLGGFPLSTNILKKLQSAFALFNSLGQIAGDKTIIAGCTVAGSNVGNGVVFVNDECFEFRGGVAQAKVIIKEDADTLVFGNNNSYPVIKTRYVTFGTGVGQMDWADFKKPTATKELPTNLATRLAAIEKKVAVFQSGGGMVLWNKPAIDIPEGWQEVVDWKGRIPVGMDVTQPEFNTLGKQGGAKEKMLSDKNMAPHQHATNWGTSTYSPPDGYVEPEVIGAAGASASKKNYLTSKELYSETNTPVEAQEAVDILNPYRTVLFIEFIG